MDHSDPPSGYMDTFFSTGASSLSDIRVPSRISLCESMIHRSMMLLLQGGHTRNCAVVPPQHSPSFAQQAACSS
jgi:hypothetical protein